MLKLLPWWFRRLKYDVLVEFRQWANAEEWPLLYVGVVFFLSFVFHWIGYRAAVHRIGWHQPIFEPTEWEGRTGWRKPLVFGISNAMIFVSLRCACQKQGLVPRRLTSHIAAWSTALEVGIITLQAWRGVPSHFNTSTLEDTALYIVKLFGVLILSAACIGVTAGNLMKPACANPVQSVALRHGLLLLCLSIAVGICQVAYGHSSRHPKLTEMPHCQQATAGLTGSPCYEIHGEAIVKLAHFLPLHATEVLLLLAWATTAAAMHRSTSLVIMQIAAASCWAISVLGLWATWHGISIKHPSFKTALAAALSLLPIPAAFAFVFLSPLSPKNEMDNAEDCKQQTMSYDRLVHDRQKGG